MTKFDIEAAKEMIEQMKQYCYSIQDNGVKLYNLPQNYPEWNDPQTDSFGRSMDELVNQLNRILTFQSEYLNTYNQRVEELTGETI